MRELEGALIIMSRFADVLVVAIKLNATLFATPLGNGIKNLRVNPCLFFKRPTEPRVDQNFSIVDLSGLCSLCNRGISLA